MCFNKIKDYLYKIILKTFPHFDINLTTFQPLTSLCYHASLPGLVEIRLYKMTHIKDVPFAHFQLMDVETYRPTESDNCSPRSTESTCQITPFLLPSQNYAYSSKFN